MNHIKKFILYLTTLPLIGKYFNKAVNLYRRFLILERSAAFYTNNFSELVNEISAQKQQQTNAIDAAEYVNLIRSVPVSLRQIQLKLTELQNRIIYIENSLPSRVAEKVNE